MILTVIISVILVYLVCVVLSFLSLCFLLSLDGHGCGLSVEDKMFLHGLPLIPLLNILIILFAVIELIKYIFKFELNNLITIVIYRKIYRMVNCEK